LSRIAPVTVSAALPEGGAVSGWRDALGAYVQTTKPGITKLVTITAMVGLGMGFAARWSAGDTEWSALRIAAIVVGSIVGTALSAAGANALNQWVERERDAKMPRTAWRPIPSGRLPARHVLLAAIGLALAGLALLWATCGVAPMGVSAACVLVYVLLYTPMKAATWTATFVGAIPGALPPLIGWSAAYGERGFESLLAPGGLSLFTLMFIWQLPHFLAIAWMYKDDYAMGGCAVLPVVDRSGAKTSVVIAACTVLLIPATISPLIAMPGVLGLGYLFTAAVSGLAFSVLVARLLRSMRREHARSVFFASIIHLPLLLAVMVLDALVHALA
jgi:protoheme IX farnesyltransferase